MVAVAMAAVALVASAVPRGHTHHGPPTRASVSDAGTQRLGHMPSHYARDPSGARGVGGGRGVDERGPDTNPA